MQSYHLADEFTDIAAEQALLASLVQSPALYWDLLDLLTPDVFTNLNLARISVNVCGVASCFNQPMALSIAGVPISRTGGPSL